MGDYGAQRWLYDKFYEDKLSYEVFIKALLETNQPSPARILQNSKKPGKVEATTSHRFWSDIERDFTAINQTFICSNRSTNTDGEYFTRF